MKKICFDENNKIIIEYWEQKLKYKIENLSDWERVALYFLIKIIFAEKDSIIIVDEWETHLNPALLYDLWNYVEEERGDCYFLYITHNIDFALSRNDNTIFWIKSFRYPLEWKLEKIDNEENIPEELILRIIWVKKQKILFVEWREEKLYQKIYDDFKVISVGSCINVINYVKSFRNRSQNYNKEYFWLIDRDFRWEEEIKSLEKEKIFSLSVWEYENLFFSENIIKFLFVYLWKEEYEINNIINEIEKELKKILKEEKFKEDFYKYYVQQQFNKNLQNFNINNKDNFLNINFDEIDCIYNGILKLDDVNKILEKINFKWIKWLSTKLWYDFLSYEKQIINLFNAYKKDEFRKEFMKIMPDIK